MAQPKSLSYEQLKGSLKLRLAELLEDDATRHVSSRLTREMISTHVRTMLNETAEAALSAEDRERLISEVATEILGLGPLETLLADPQISEIMVNGPSQIYVERQGKLEQVPQTFQDLNHLMTVLERLLDSVGASATGSEPCVDASLPDGTRLNVIIPPVAPNGPVITIRKRSQRWTVRDLMALGTFNQEMAEFLQACVKVKTNILVSGGTSTGKTTLVSVLSEWIPAQERIITIENVSELDLPNRTHWVRLVGRTPNVDGRGEISLRILVRNALRMRPDRLILGEARGGEGLDVVQAMHTGHEGVITILHANSPHAALERLETLMLMSGLELPPQACRTQIASAVDVLIHMARFPDGTRRVAAVTQLMGSSQTGFELEPLFVFEVDGYSPEGQLRGHHRYTGARPKFLPKFHVNNVEVPAWVTV